MFHIKNLLPQAIRRAGMSNQVEAGRIVMLAQDVLKDLFGDDIARHMQTWTFRSGTLSIRCAHSMYSQELAWQQKEIIHAINTRLGTTDIVRLHTHQ